MSFRRSSDFPVRSDALLSDIVDGPTIAPTWPAEGTDETKTATMGWRSASPRKSAVTETATGYYHRGLLQARGRHGASLITRYPQELTDVRQPNRTFATTSPSSLIPVGISALLMGITVGSSPTDVPRCATSSIATQLMGINLDGQRGSVDDVSELDATYCRW